MTSNIGSELILEADDINAQVRQDIEKMLHQKFRPEFLNRIDAVVFFRRLTLNDVEKIAQLHLNELEQRLVEKQISVKFDKEVLKKISELGYQKEFGARPLKRAIQRYITVPLSQFLLSHPDTKKIDIVVKNDAIVVV